MHTLVITDSRGTRLQEHLDKINKKDRIRVLYFKGAGYQRAAERALPVIKRYRPKYIILLLGICDITNYDRSTKTVTLKTPTTAPTINRVMYELREACRLIGLFHTCPISCPTITGVDLADYNHRTPRIADMDTTQYEHYTKNVKTTHPHQLIMNQIIEEVNKQIIAHNREASTPIIWTSKVVHPYNHHRYSNHYHKLLDGCHQRPEVTRQWAAMITKAVNRISPQPSTGAQTTS